MRYTIKNIQDRIHKTKFMYVKVHNSIMQPASFQNFQRFAWVLKRCSPIATKYVKNKTKPFWNAHKIKTTHPIIKILFSNEVHSFGFGSGITVLCWLVSTAICLA